MPRFEVVTDDATVWVNDATGLIGRFSKRGIDVHVNGACQEDTCVPGPCTLTHWEEFKAKMLEHHGIAVSNRYKPKFLRR